MGREVVDGWITWSERIGKGKSTNSATLPRRSVEVRVLDGGWAEGERAEWSEAQGLWRVAKLISRKAVGGG